LNRSLSLFLVFLLVLVLLGGIGTWYLGPAVVSLAVDEDRRDSPFYLLHLTAIPGGAESSPFRSELTELVTADGGQLLWRAATIQLLEGRVQDEWQNLQLFEFARGGDFVQMLTSTGYRQLRAAHPLLLRLALGTSEAPDGIVSSGAAVLSLFRVDEDSAEFARGARELASNLEQFEGSLIWEAPLVDLDGDVGWNRVMVFEFPRVDAAQRWVRDPTTMTQRALIKRGTSGMVTLIVQSS